MENDDREEIGAATLKELWEHHWWSFEQFLDEAGTLSTEDFTRDLGISYSSIHGALAHLVGSEIVWLKRVQEGESLTYVPGTKELQDFRAVEDGFERSKAGWQEVLEKDDLKRTIQYTNTKGNEFRDPLWRVMAHILDHSAAYRGVLIAAFRILGRTPPASGLITYTRLTTFKL